MSSARIALFSSSRCCRHRWSCCRHRSTSVSAAAARRAVHQVARLVRLLVRVQQAVRLVPHRHRGPGGTCPGQGDKQQTHQSVGANKATGCRMQHGCGAGVWAQPRSPTAQACSLAPKHALGAKGDECSGMASAGRGRCGMGAERVHNVGGCRADPGRHVCVQVVYGGLWAVAVRTSSRSRHRLWCRGSRAAPPACERVRNGVGSETGLNLY